MWGSRSTISGEDTLELVQEDFSLLLAVMSHTSEPFFFRGGGTPILSFSALMYFQKGFELCVWSPWVMVLLMYSHSALRILLLHVFGMNL